MDSPGLPPSVAESHSTRFCTIAGLFSPAAKGVSATLAVPAIQRPYVWTGREVGDFFDDIFASYSAGEEHFCLNTVYTLAGDERQLLDGQQRVTTFFLLACLLRDLMGGRKREAARERVARLRIVHSCGGPQSDLLSQLASSSQQARHLAGRRDGAGRGGVFEGRLRCALVCLHKRLTAAGGGEDEMAAIFEYVWDRVFCIEVQFTRVADANRTFRLMNSRGVPMSFLSRVKCAFLHRIDTSLQLQATFATHWDALYEKLGGEAAMAGVVLLATAVFRMWTDGNSVRAAFAVAAGDAPARDRLLLGQLLRPRGGAGGGDELGLVDLIARDVVARLADDEARLGFCRHVIGSLAQLWIEVFGGSAGGDGGDENAEEDRVRDCYKLLRVMSHHTADARARLWLLPLAAVYPLSLSCSNEETKSFFDALCGPRGKARAGRMVEELSWFERRPLHLYAGGLLRSGMVMWANAKVLTYEEMMLKMTVDILQLRAEPATLEVFNNPGLVAGGLRGKVKYDRMQARAASRLNHDNLFVAYPTLAATLLLLLEAERASPANNATPSDPTAFSAALGEGRSLRRFDVDTHLLDSRFAQVEHILPRRIRRPGRRAAAGAPGAWSAVWTSQLHEMALHRLGNLILLRAADNGSAGNRDFPDKVTVYRRHCEGWLGGYGLVRDFVNEYSGSSWGPDAFMRRHISMRTSVRRALGIPTSTADDEELVVAFRALTQGESVERGAASIAPIVLECPSSDSGAIRPQAEPTGAEYAEALRSRMAQWVNLENGDYAAVIDKLQRGYDGCPLTVPAAKWKLSGDPSKKLRQYCDGRPVKAFAVRYWRAVERIGSYHNWGKDSNPEAAQNSGQSACGVESVASSSDDKLRTRVGDDAAMISRPVSPREGSRDLHSLSSEFYSVSSGSLGYF